MVRMPPVFTGARRITRRTTKVGRRGMVITIMVIIMEVLRPGIEEKDGLKGERHRM